MSNASPAQVNTASVDQLLAQLPAAIQPNEISWWPPAPGWIVLTLLILGLLIFFGYRQWQCYRETQIPRLAREQLKLLAKRRRTTLAKKEGTTHAQSEAGASVLSIAMLIRWVCKDYFRDNALITTSGDAWLQQLDTLALTKKKTLSGSAGQTLLKIYKDAPASDEEVAQLETACSDWLDTVIQQHRKIKRQRVAIESTAVTHSLLLGSRS